MRNRSLLLAAVGSIVVGGCTELLGDFTIADGSAPLGPDSSMNDVTNPNDATPNDATTNPDVSIPPAEAGPGCGHLKEACCATGNACVLGSCCNAVCLDESVNADNCGACGHSCGGTTSCVNSQCKPTVLATIALSGPSAIQVDANNVYFGLVNNGAGAVYSCDKVSGCPSAPTPLIKAVGFPADISVIGSNVFVTDFKSSSIFECATTGCVQATKVPVTSLWFGLATNGSLLFSASSNFVQQFFADGTGTVTLGNNGQDIAVEPSNVYVYWTPATGNSPFSISVGKVGFPNSAQPFYANADKPIFVATDKTNVYWETQTGAIFGCAIGVFCNNATSLSKTNHNPPTFGGAGLTADNVTGNVYWTAIDPNNAHVFSIAGNGSQTQATELLTIPTNGTGNVGGVAVDGTSIFVAVEVSGVTTLYRVPK